MLSFTILITFLLWAVPQALAGVAGSGCHQKPYRKMQEFRKNPVARGFCHRHWPEPTTRKTVTPTCLTTTSTIVVSSTTVTATKTKRCSTTEDSPLPSSVYPVPYDNTKREATPAPISLIQAREAEPFPVPEVNESWGELAKRANKNWNFHRQQLNECGYECIQRACSCMARTHTIYVRTITNLAPQYVANPLFRTPPLQPAPKQVQSVPSSQRHRQRLCMYPFEYGIKIEPC